MKRLLRQSFSISIVFLLVFNSFVILSLYSKEDIPIPPIVNEAVAFSGGDGSSGNPFRISNLTELQWMGNNSNLDKNFILVNDINAGETSTWNLNKGFVPVGNKSDPFAGAFDGQGYNITNLFIDRGSTRYIGLFGYVAPIGIITNVSVLECDVTGDDDVGGLVGHNNGTVYNSFATGNVSGDYSVGGLIGYLWGTGIVDISSAMCNVSGSGWYIGGLVGYNWGSINNSNVSSHVTGHSWTGGLVGLCYGTVNNSYSSSYVTANGDRIGGLVGYLSNTGLANNSYATGNVTSVGDEVGGLVGRCWRGAVRNSFASGNVSGVDYIGGLVGRNFEQVNDSYATGNVSGNSDVGGLVGENSGVIRDSHAMGNVTSSSNRVGGFVGYNKWGTIYNSYSLGFVDGGGTEVGGFAGYHYAGLINSSFSTGNVSGSSFNTGGFAGSSGQGRFLNSYSTGDVRGVNSYVGGFIGYQVSNAEILRSFASGNVTGENDYVGGFIGCNSDGTINNSYATGNASGNYAVGGFVGFNDDEISNSYSTGNVSGTSSIGGFSGLNLGTIECCFWDTQSSGRASSDGGSGKTKMQMKTKSTFTTVGWDFITVWGIMNGLTYPYLNPCEYGTILTSNVEHTRVMELYHVEYEALPPYPGTNMTWNLSTSASSWLSIDQNGILKGTPSMDDSGSVWVNISTRVHGFTLDSTNFTLQIQTDNHYPYITNNAPSTALEDVSYGFDFTANDDDLGDALTWGWESNATWLTFNSLTANLSGTPDNSHVGHEWWINITVSDDLGASDYTNFTITVANTALVIITNDDTSCLEDEEYNVDYASTDDGQGVITWHLITDASFLEINSTSGILSGLPTNDDVGSFWVNVSVDDGNAGWAWHNFSLDVENVNDRPFWLDVPSDSSIYVSTAYSYDVNTSDIDNLDIITYSISSTPSSSISINSTGMIEWTPSSVGSYAINLSASDGNVTLYHEFTLEVVRSITNSAPTSTLATPLNNSVVEILNPSLSWTILDEDGDNITVDVYLGTNLMDVSTLSSTTRIAHNHNTTYIIPSPALTASTTYYWTVIPSDGIDTGVCLSSVWKFTVSDTAIINNPPYFTSTPGLSAIVDIEWSYIPIASDDDGDPISMTLSIGPSGMMFDETTLTWIPTNEQSGDHIVKINASDGKVTVSQEFTLSVTLDFVNSPPVSTLKTPIDGSTVDVLNPVLTWDTMDVDGHNVSVDVFLSPDLASVSSNNASTKIGEDIHEGYLVSPSELIKGSTYYWVVIPTDGFDVGSCSSGIWSFDISDTATTNSPPVFTSSPELMATVGIEWSYTPVASDDDGDSLTISFISGPTGMDFDGTILTWTPLSNQIGDHQVKLELSDGKVTIPEIFTLTASNQGITNNPPTIELILDQTIIVGETLSLQVVADDSDGDTLQFSIDNGPNGLTIDGYGKILWTPTKDDIGTNTVIVMVSDGDLNTTRSFTVTVQDKGGSGGEDISPLAIGGIIGLIVILLLLIAAIIAAVIILTRKKEPALEVHEAEEMLVEDDQMAKEKEKDISESSDDVVQKIAPSSKLQEVESEDRAPEQLETTESGIHDHEEQSELSSQFKPETILEEDSPTSDDVDLDDLTEMEGDVEGTDMVDDSEQGEIESADLSDIEDEDLFGDI